MTAPKKSSKSSTQMSKKSKKPKATKKRIDTSSVLNRINKSLETTQALNRMVLTKIISTPDDVSRLSFIYEPVFHEANARMKSNMEHGIYNTAMEQVYEENQGSYFFNPEQYKDVDTLRTHLAQARVFLNDQRSNPSAALLDEVQRRVIEADMQSHVGRKFAAENKVTYDTNFVSLDQARRAYKAYRALEANMQGAIGRQGDSGVYGSENLIMALLEFEISGRSGEDWEETRQYGQEILNAFKEEHSEVFNPIRDRFNSIGDFIFDDFYLGGVF